MSQNENASLRPRVNWIVLLVVTLVMSVILLIAAAVVGLDKGVLNNMARTEFARGLITYLFAVLTIGTAVVLVLSALIAEEGTFSKERFDRGKEILALLLGVFGTIVGFYFGSEAAGPRADTSAVQVSTLDVSPRVVEPGDTVTVRAVVTGGVSPYRFGIGLGDDTVEAREAVAEGGWITKEAPVRQFQSQEARVIRVIVQDASGRRVEQIAPIAIGAPR